MATTCNHQNQHQNPSEKPYVHLHVHTEYSLLDGINKVNRLPAYAKQMGMPAVAMTDHGNVSGSYKFYKECKKQDIKPIIGMEAYYTINDRTAKEPDHLGKSYYHLILLAQNNIGLHYIIKKCLKIDFLWNFNSIKMKSNKL